MKVKRILVTGGAGMIGSNLVKRLIVDPNNEVHVIDNLWRGRLENLIERRYPIINFESQLHVLDLKCYEKCKEVIGGFDEVYHLADIVAGIGYVFGNQASIFSDNTLINTNVLKSAAETGVNKLLYVGTACSYPQEKQSGANAPPLKEEDILPANPESAYGWSKLMGEYETLLYGRETKMQTGVLRLHNVYGAPCDFSPERSQVIPALVRKALLYPNEPFIVWGSGAQGRSFIHVDDVVGALILMMRTEMGQETIQIGTNICTTIRELAEIIVRLSGKPIHIEYDDSKPEGDKGRCADCSRAESILGWEQKISIEEGLTKTYKWIEGEMFSTHNNASAD